MGHKNRILILRYLNYILFLLAVAVVVLTLYVTRRQAVRLTREEQENIHLWAEATRRAVDLSNPSQDYAFILHVIERNESVPVVLTNAERMPISMRNIPPNVLGDSARMQALIDDFIQLNEPIRILFPSGDEHYVFYGQSATLRELRFYPFVQLGLIVALILFGYLVFHHARQAEQNSVWVGMARETAHQLGTPISSLVAWQQLLEMGDMDMIDTEVLSESLGMDVQRLQRVAERFSKIGSKAQREQLDLRETVEASVAYMRGRMSQRIALSLEVQNTPVPVQHNAVLLQWVIENLLRNAMDAMPHGGRIALTLRYSENRAQIDCADTGCGIPKRKWRSVFRPGYSTKTRGWGLGLSLARRIVKEYHKGKIFVLESSPQRGTTFRILLPH